LVQAAAHASATMVARDGLFTHATFRRINGRCTRGAGNEIGATVIGFEWWTGSFGQWLFVAMVIVPMIFAGAFSYLAKH